MCADKLSGSEKHTPGPWQASTVKGDVLVHGPGGDCIAWCNGIRVDNAANARLLARAPQVEELARELALHVINEGVGQSRDEARTLLALLEGKQ